MFIITLNNISRLISFKRQWPTFYINFLNVILCGMVNALHEITTKNDNEMKFIFKLHHIKINLKLAFKKKYDYLKNNV